MGTRALVQWVMSDGMCKQLATLEQLRAVILNKSDTPARPRLIVNRDYRRVLAHADLAPELQKGQVVLLGTADDVAGSAALATYRCPHA